MTNQDVNVQLGQLIKSERGITIQILNLIQVGLRQRSFLEFGFASMFDWLTRGFGYSNAAAYRRIEAARLSMAVPEVAEKIESGKLNLTSLCTLQTAIKNEERLNGGKVSIEVKRTLVESIECKSQPQVQKLIIAELKSAALSVSQDRRIRIDAATVRHSLNLCESTSNNLQRAKELLSHKLPNASDADVIGEVLKFFLEKRDPLRQPLTITSAAEVKNRKTLSPRLRHQILKSNEGCCSYQDPTTGIRCASKFQLEIDHIVPRAKGGTNEIANLRTLCRQHNLMMAEKCFGKAIMARYRR